MPYKPLIPANLIQKYENSLVRRSEISGLLLRLFGSEILPSRQDFPRCFAPSDILDSLYLQDRVSPLHKDRAADQSETHYEELLDKKFWGGNTSPPLILVLGSVGSGKSTFVDYYIRCHCFHRGNHKDRFERKLILFFDAKAIQESHDFYHHFFLQGQASIRFQCRDRRIDIDYIVGRRPTKPNNVREWVWAALEELTTAAAKKEQSSFEFLGLVVDNLDQASQSVQRRAVTEVEQWLLTPTIKLSRVIIPLWETTYNSLRNSDFVILRRVDPLQFGRIIPDNVVEDRKRALSRRIDSIVNEPELSQFFSRIFALAKPRIASIIEGLSNGDLRRLLHLWSGVLCSSAAYGIWKHSSSHDSNRRHEYEFLDALFTGGMEALSQTDLRVPNVFDFKASCSTPRDLLIGPHALHIMNTHVITSRYVLFEILETLGYTDRGAEHLESLFRSYNILHEFPMPGGDVGYQVHESVVQTYLGHPNATPTTPGSTSISGDHVGLIYEAAYVDNVAIVTPVDDETLAAMKPTRGDLAEHFRPRVETTMAFLRFLRRCEERFCDVARLPQKLDSAAFAESLREKKLPCLWVKMARPYHHRLNRLRVVNILDNVPSDWWQTTLKDPLWAEAEKASELLVPFDSSGLLAL